MWFTTPAGEAVFADDARLADGTNAGRCVRRIGRLRKGLFRRDRALVHACAREGRNVSDAEWVSRSDRRLAR
jgi:hypothetical protein